MEATIAKGYKQINLPELQSELREKYRESGKTYIALAYELGIKSITTIQNILTPADEEKQVVSDEMLTKFINHLGIEAFVKWENGERNYYIKN
jgi:hypothetical protein